MASTSLPPNVKFEVLRMLGIDEKCIVDSEWERPNVLPPCILGNNVRYEHMKYFTKQDIHNLHTNGYVVKDGFLAEQSGCDDVNASGVRDAIVDLRKSGVLRQAKMQSESEQWTKESHRGDEIAWLSTLDMSEQSRHLSVLWSSLLQVRDELNECSDEFQCHGEQCQLAYYPGNGARYVKHRDVGKDVNSMGQRHRRLTILYYANSEWQCESGGCLRVHALDRAVDIEPVADRVVMFSSEWLLHEVLPTYAPRYSLTMWLY